VPRKSGRLGGVAGSVVEYVSKSRDEKTKRVVRALLAITLTILCLVRQFIAHCLGFI
jgi:hypothetical protein